MTKRLSNDERAALAATVLVTLAVSVGRSAPSASAGTRLDTALDAIRTTVHRDPLKATLATVAASALAFYAAERGHNPRVHTLDDALVYCSTALSVGYDQTFPVTPLGKRIAAALMTLGPSLAARALDPPQRG
jgi:voltage-gated potassium channel Kch